uniref:Uncharacterized protein n=1 Tax=Monodon monoceros TaxID=40151 RepID=A0A8C6B535_MONMO
ISGSYGMHTFNVIRNYQVVFQSGHTMLFSHQQGMRVPVSLQPLNSLVFSLFFNASHSNRYAVVYHCDLILHFPDD